MPSMSPIQNRDGVVVHGWLVHEGADETWWATRGRSMLFANDSDRLLLHIAVASGRPPDLGDLRGRLHRAIDDARRDRAQEELYAQRRPQGQ